MSARMRRVCVRVLLIFLVGRGAGPIWQGNKHTHTITKSHNRTQSRAHTQPLSAGGKRVKGSPFLPADSWMLVALILLSLSQ